MTERTTITLYLAVNEKGEFEIAIDSAHDAIEILNDNCGYEAVRVVTLNVTVDLPKPESVNITVPDQTPASAQVTVS